MSVPPCFKCKAGVAFVSSRDGPRKPYCIECFVNYVGSQIRETFYRQCRVPSDCKVCVAVSGGPSSMALLDILRTIRDWNLAESRGTKGKIHYHFLIFHVDEREVLLACGRAVGAPFPDVPRHCEEQRKIVESRCKELAFEFSSLRASDLIPVALLSAISQCTQLSDKEELFEAARRRCLLEATRRLGATSLIVGESGTTLATRALLEVVRGRGDALPHLCGVAATLSGVRVFRPLRTVLAKELVMFCRAQGVPFTYSLLPSSVCSVQLPSVSSTMTAFSSSLQGPYRSTPFNINNSVGRLTMSVNKCNHCLICSAPVLSEPADLCYSCKALRGRCSKIPSFVTEFDSLVKDPLPSVGA